MGPEGPAVMRVTDLMPLWAVSAEPVEMPVWLEMVPRVRLAPKA